MVKSIECLSPKLQRHLIVQLSCLKRRNVYVVEARCSDIWKSAGHVSKGIQRGIDKRRRIEPRGCRGMAQLRTHPWHIVWSCRLIVVSALDKDWCSGLRSDNGVCLPTSNRRIEQFSRCGAKPSIVSEGQIVYERDCRALGNIGWIEPILCFPIKRCLLVCARHQRGICAKTNR